MNKKFAILAAIFVAAAGFAAAAPDTAAPATTGNTPTPAPVPPAPPFPPLPSSGQAAKPNMVSSSDGLLFSETSPYHNIQVENKSGERTLYFDDTMESRMKISDPFTGGFEYTDYFQMIWLWNPDIKSVLMEGLGGASTQKALFHYHPEVKIETVEIDPMVADVAQKFFAYTLSDRQKLNLMDGRVFLQHNNQKYDAILMDAYTQGRYGASIPPHLVTEEFFKLAKDHLTPNGVLAYNVITVLPAESLTSATSDRPIDIVAAIYHTLKEVFPQVNIFAAKESLNIVIVASLTNTKTDLATLKKTGAALVESKKITFPNFLDRIDSFVAQPPANYLDAPVLLDEFAPVESLTRPAAITTPAKPKTP